MGAEFNSLWPSNALWRHSSGSTLAQVMVLLQWCHNGRDGVTNYRRLNCYSTVCSGANQRKHQSPASLAFVRGIHRWLMNSPHKMTVTRKMFPFDDVIMLLQDVFMEHHFLWVHRSQGESNIRHFNVTASSYDENAYSLVHQWSVQRKQDIITYMALRKTGQIHDDAIKWKHFPFYWPFVWGIHQSPVNSSHKGQWCGTLMFSLICAWTNDWVNNRDAGDLGRHRDLYDVTVMTCGPLEHTASKSIVESNIFWVLVGLGAGWLDMYFIWYIILL